MKDDQDKPDFTLIPPFSIEEVAKVFTYGAKKYEPFGWLFVEHAIDRYLAATLRHVFSYLQDMDKVDEESGLSPLAHAAASLLIACEHEIRNREKHK